MSDTWRHGGDADGPDTLLRPVWETDPDETDADDRGRRSAAVRPVGGALSGTEALALLGPLAAASEALGRLDAAAAAALEPVRAGLLARMAYAEAAGWLAHAHVWADPLDLALRDLDLTGSYALASATGRARRDLPNTFARHATRPWEDLATEAVMASDTLVATAQTLAHTLLRLGRGRTDPFADYLTTAATLKAFGPDIPSATRWMDWRSAVTAMTGPGRGGMPALLSAARAAELWMRSGVLDLPLPLPAMLASVALLVCGGLTRVILPPIWAAYPTIGHGPADALPGLRSDVAARLGGTAGCGWMFAFLHFVAEGARAGSRELDRLLAAAEQGRGMTAGCDCRSRLPDAIDAALRTPALTPKALARQLHIAPQTATALLRELRTAKLVREVTGRRSFRAFAV